MKIIVTLFLVLATSISATGPDFVLEIFRHGARSVESSEYDNTWDDIGYAELTSVGIRQHYVLGRILRERYPDLLLPYNPNNIRVFASDKNRTLMSVTSQLYGIYQGSGLNLPNGLESELATPPFTPEAIGNVTSNITFNAAAFGNFQPIPIHSDNGAFDYLLQPYVNCIALSSLYNLHANDENVQELFAELNETVSFFESNGYEINNMKNLKSLGDAAISAHYYGKTLPANISADSQIYRDLELAYEWYEVYASLAESYQRQVFSAPLFSQLLNYIENVQRNTSPVKFTFWSAHETTLFTMLAALNVSTPECLVANWKASRANETIPYPDCIYPKFAANLIFEFYNTSDPYVIVKYEDNVLRLCNNQEACSLNDFQNLIQNATLGIDLNQYYSICNISQGAQVQTFATVETEFGYSKNLVYAMGSIITLLATLVTILTILLIKKSAKTNSASNNGYYIAQRA